MILAITVVASLLLVIFIERWDKRSGRADGTPEPNPHSVAMKKKYGKPNKSGLGRLV